MSELSSALIKDLTFRVLWYLSPPVLLLLYTHRVMFRPRSPVNLMSHMLLSYHCHVNLRTLIIYKADGMSTQ